MLHKNYPSSQGPIAICYPKENKTLVFGSCEPVCDNKIESLPSSFNSSIFDQHSLEQCLQQNHAQHFLKCENLICKNNSLANYKLLKTETGDGKRGFFCDKDGEWVTNVRCATLCPDRPDGTDCVDRADGETCRIRCPEGMRSSDKSDRFLSTCRAGNGSASWDKSRDSACHQAVSF